MASTFLCNKKCASRCSCSYSRRHCSNSHTVNHISRHYSNCRRQERSENNHPTESHAIPYKFVKDCTIYGGLRPPNPRFKRVGTKGASRSTRSQARRQSPKAQTVNHTSRHQAKCRRTERSPPDRCCTKDRHTYR